MELFVEKILPELLKGKTSKIKLIIAANNNKFCKLFTFLNTPYFFTKKTINIDASPKTRTKPTIPKSVSISM